MPKTLQEELIGQMRKSRILASLDFWLAEILYLIAVGSSVVTAINGAGGWITDQKLVALIAAMPAAALLIDKSFRLRERSNWHYEYLGELNALNRELRDQGATVAAVSQKRSKLTRTMEVKSPGRQLSGIPSGG